MGNADLIISPRTLSCQQEPGLFCLMFAAMLPLFSCVNLWPAPSACSRLESGIQMHFFISFLFFSFFFFFIPVSPGWWQNWSTNICLSWSNTFLYSAESSLFIQLSNCSVHLEIQKKAQGQSSEKQNWHELGWWIEMHMAEVLEWKGMGGAEVSKAVLTLPQLCSAEGSSVVVADKQCRIWLSKGVFGTQGCFPRSSLDCSTSNLTAGIHPREARISAWNVQVKSSTVL